MSVVKRICPKAIFYSSCNPVTPTKEPQISSGYYVTKVQLFDMFPHTDHFEVLCLLEKQRC